ncbi:glycosyltransferase [candidate division CSSED10-310 bacterium]|uniref:Glycosyltransferase n=1 Tax=candidate division CSSED10-310 bacterium TaxID=2855610 RepID=A0ABV6YRQ1_UNCC1
MKILFINAQDTKGGAAIAPYRLSKGLDKYFGTENYFIVGKKHSGDANIFWTRKNEAQAAIEVLTDKVMNKLGLQYQYFPFSSRFILKKTRELQPDIISLHNTHEGYFKTALLTELSKMAPIAWTLHDMWSFTANAAHTFGDESWKQLRGGKGEKKIYPPLGLNTGRWLLRQKRRIYRKSNIHLITPSNWLYNLVKQSPVFENKPVVCIPHGINTEIFKKRDKLQCRKMLDLDPKANIIIFTSAGHPGLCPWKGGQHLVDILKILDEKADRKIIMMFVGKGELSLGITLKNLSFQSLGFVHNERFMPLLLSAADLFIYPTLADSFGLVLAESICCGTPAISFDVGGVGDIIKNDVSGYLIDAFQVDDFVAQIIELMNNKEKLAALSDSALHFAFKNFDLQQVAKRYFELFESILVS